MSTARDQVRLKRVYDDPEPGDGFRVLVDRLWPRGLTKSAARVDLWMKEVAPSKDLRRWYHADLTRWAEFRRRYRAELADLVVESPPIALRLRSANSAHWCSRTPPHPRAAGRAEPGSRASRSSTAPRTPSRTTPSCCARC